MASTRRTRLVRAALGALLWARGVAALCPPDARAPTGSADVSACECNAGFQGAITDSASRCAACEAGKFKAAAGGDACLSCGRGTYTAYSGQTACRLCPQNSASLAVGSTSVQDCLCKEGYTGAVNDCTRCLKGTYKPAIGSDVCQNCAAGKYSADNGASACAACQDASTSPERSFAANQCVCNAGYAGEACAACPAGTATSGSVVPRSCVGCEPGKYAGLASASCATCPPGTTTSGDKTSAASCVCAQGYTKVSCVE